MNSRDKGAKGERELARKLKEYGYDCRRGQQYCGANGDADVVGLPGIHIEAKHCEKLQPYDWMEQSKRDAKDGDIPVVIFKKNDHEVLVQMRFEDFMSTENGWFCGSSVEAACIDFVKAIVAETI